jgi:hypothetical protein
MMVRMTRCQTAVRRQTVKLHGAVSLLPEWSACRGIC